MALPPLGATSSNPSTMDFTMENMRLAGEVNRLEHHNHALRVLLSLALEQLPEDALIVPRGDYDERYTKEIKCACDFLEGMVVVTSEEV